MSCLLRWAIGGGASRASSRLPTAGLWLLPLRDLLSFAVFVASFFGRNVSWRDQLFRVEPERAHDRWPTGDRRRVMMKTLFLHPPSFDGFDGGAGSRYQAKREIRSFWYPTWLAQPAALVPGSKLIDAPPARLRARRRCCRWPAITSWWCCTPRPRPSPRDVKVAEALKDANPKLKIGFVGAKVAVEPEDSLDRVARHRFRRPRGIRLHDQGGRRRPRLRRRSTA